MAQWNPWHGCHKISPGCQHCYVFRMDARFDRDPTVVSRTANFQLPVRKDRHGQYRLASGETIYTCFSSDFFIEEADEWRKDAWKMIRQRSDLDFFIITKRIERFRVSLPDDWGEGYPNVTLCATCETQDRAAFRLPVLMGLPLKHRAIICEPLLESVDLSAWLGPMVEHVVVGGESGPDARICDFQWVLDIRKQCVSAGVPFHFKQTGANFFKEGRLYRIDRKYQHTQAAKAGIDYYG